MIFLFVIFLLTSLAFAHEISNGVIDKPEVFCGIDTIRVNVNTERSFKGRIYVDGESDKQHCVQQSDVNSENNQFSIPIGACNMRRQRTLHPRGIAFSFTMIVSFHPFFVTGMDRAFSIRCFFLESIKGLNANIDVGTIAPQNIDQEYSLPVCAYHLKDATEGHVLRFAQVGQKVTHLWRCDQDASHVYGILIHSCFADDGHGNKFELVDDRGCSTDPYLLPQIEYENNAISAFTNANVFKYADKVQLYFTCTVQLCYKHDGGCEGITPPQCGGGGNRYFGPPRSEHGKDDEHQNENKVDGSHEKEDQAKEDDHFFKKAPEFQPILLGPPSPTVFSPDSLPLSPFKGPKELQEEPNPYRRDSPLNETEEDIIMEVVTLRTTIGTPTPSTAELVTFKPISTTSSNTSPTTTKVRRTVGEMETDVSVDVIVLPVEDKERKDSNSSPQPLSFQNSSEVCISKTSTALLSTALLIVLICCCTVTFLVSRNRLRREIHNKRRLDNF
ncbi:unnamed protein product [Caenorhabditis angaria]|uniref:ZP domain-containing protein n=1 Tax=Caenorhabditis angaria TaxID=860376 RepID=A0A9P1MW64_9PELO|nr:unnamed protein product [Caenorhabditis angaria]